MPIVDHHQTLPLFGKTYSSKTSPTFVMWRHHNLKEPGSIRLDMRLHHSADLRFFSLLRDAFTNALIMEKLSFFAPNVIPRDEQCASSGRACPRTLKIYGCLGPN